MLIDILTITQMIVGVLLIVVVLLQQKSAGLGATFGGGGGGNVASTKRGADLFLFRTTIVLSILFFGIAFALLLI